MHSSGQHTQGWLRMGRQRSTLLPLSCCLAGGLCVVFPAQLQPVGTAFPVQPFPCSKAGKGHLLSKDLVLWASPWHLGTELSAEQRGMRGARQ